MPAMKDLSSTLQRSPKKAEENWAKTHESAVETDGEGEQPHRATSRR